MAQATFPKDTASAGAASDFQVLHRRDASDPMQLLPRIRQKLETYFRQRNLTPLPGQIDLLMEAASTVLENQPGALFGIPFQPGLGKSTLIRAILEVMSKEFCFSTPIVQQIGGIIVVVEKTDEGQELENLCNEAAGRTVARAIYSANDSILGKGRCLNGTAHCYKECPRRNCPDYERCPLMHPMEHTDHTPILIILQARYQFFMEDMSPFLTWYDGTQEHRRTLLLVDELPNMIDERKLDVQCINQLDSSLALMHPSYNPMFAYRKERVRSLLQVAITYPFNRLRYMVNSIFDPYGVISWEDLEKAGFSPQKLYLFQQALTEYLSVDNHPAFNTVDSLLDGSTFFYAVGNDISLCLPRLRQPDPRLATFLFSGTVSLSPELSRNPSVTVLEDRNLESFRRLTIHIQHSAFSCSRAGLKKEANRAAFLVWLKELLPQLRPRKVLLVTYKSWAESFWQELSDFHDILIPYTGLDGKPQNKLPYFSGMNGSNLYRESSCIICLGLNRFEPSAYINQALALDADQSILQQVQAENISLPQSPQVVEMQNLTLARDLVQLVFRSALRNHGESQPIDLYLLEPPEDVALLLMDYFQDCACREYPTLPEQANQAAAIAKSYRGQQTSAGKMLQVLVGWDGSVPLTPDDIRQQAGLTKTQYKEARKNSDVKQYFGKYIITTGSRKNTVYRKRLPNPNGGNSGSP